MLRLVFALVLVPLGGPVHACSVPVFRYALERWEADVYRLRLATADPQSEQDQAWFSQLSLDALEKAPAVNLDVGFAEGSAVAPLDSGALSAAPPLALLYPRTSGIAAPAWVGPTTESNLRRLIQSPARTEIVRRLLDGDCAVWVLLESSDAQADDVAADRITTRLKELEQELEIQALDPEDIAAGLVTLPEEELRVAFSMLRVSRSEPEEAVFVHLLLGLEDDLQGFTEPIAFPVFGRGRVLYALVGEGINDRTIGRACSFVTGPCSCQAKELNPGVDLLMAVDWDSRIERSAISTRELPPLTGVAAFDRQGPFDSLMPTQSPNAAGESTRLEAGGELDELEQGPPKPMLEPGARLATNEVAGTSATAQDHQGGWGLLAPVMVSTGGLVFVLLLAGTFLLVRRKP